MKTTPPTSLKTPDKSRPVRRGIAACATIALFTSRIFACDFCLRLPRVPFEFERPGAIEVAMATQAAAEQGELDLNPSIAMDRGRTTPLAEISARQLVAQWIGTRPAQSHPSLRCTIELIFVDVDETCWLDVRLGEVLAGDPRSGPADIRLMTTKAGFGQLRERGLVRCEQLEWAAIECARPASRDCHGIERLFAAPSKNGPRDLALRFDRQRMSSEVNSPVDQFEVADF